jgi:hypothetical protein
LDADKLTVEQTKEEVARLKGQSGANRQVIRSCGMSLSTWENVVKPAYELARMKLGSAARDDGGNAVEYSDGVCLEVICAEFLADPNNAEEPIEDEALYEELIENSLIPLPTEEI